MGTMTHRVDSRGRFTIERAIRDALGIRPGDLAVQRIENGSLVIRFARLPKPHDRSPAGALGPPPQSPSDEPREVTSAAEFVADGPFALAP